MNMIKMIQQAATMRKEMKQIQKTLAKKTTQFSGEGGKLTAVARGDMVIDSIKIDPSLLDPARVEKLEKAIITVVNGALASAKSMAGSEMSKLSSEMGLGGLMGG